MKTSSILLIFSIAFGISLGIAFPRIAQAALGTPCDTNVECVVSAGSTHPGTYSCLGGNPATTPALEGVCTGPCDKNTPASGEKSCQTNVGTPLKWAASSCTAANDKDATTAGVCSELPAGQLTAGPQSGSQLLATVDTVTNWIFAIFVVLAIIFVLLAAFQFVTAGGDATKVGEARQKLIWASVGVIIALLAKGLVPVIKSIVGG